MNNFIVGGGDIVHGEWGVAIYDYLIKFNISEELSTGCPAFFLIFYKIYLVVPR